MNAPAPGCAAEKASKPSKESVAASNNDNKWEYQTSTANALCQAAKQAKIDAWQAVLNVKDYSIDSSGGRSKDANPKSQQSAAQ